jgi:hypothetical protein
LKAIWAVLWSEGLLRLFVLRIGDSGVRDY